MPKPGLHTTEFAALIAVGAASLANSLSTGLGWGVFFESEAFWPFALVAAAYIAGRCAVKVSEGVREPPDPEEERQRALAEARAVLERLERTAPPPARGSLP